MSDLVGNAKTGYLAMRLFGNVIMNKNGLPEPLPVAAVLEFKISVKMGIYTRLTSILSASIRVSSLQYCLGQSFFYFLFYRFFSQQVRVGGRNKNKNKIHSDHFPSELKLKETRNRVSFNFNSIGKWSE